MRTDATIDKQLVKLPNASTLGFGKWKAQFGDFVVYREQYQDGSYQTRVGRMAGRVHHAPMLEGDAGATHDYLLVIAMSNDLSFVMERWIDAKDVERCYSPTEKTRQLWEFMQSDWTGYPPDHLRAWAESGYATPAQMPQK